MCLWSCCMINSATVVPLPVLQSLPQGTQWTVIIGLVHTYKNSMSTLQNWKKLQAGVLKKKHVNTMWIYVFSHQILDLVWRQPLKNSVQKYCIYYKLNISSEPKFSWKHQFALNNRNIVIKTDRFTCFMTKLLRIFFWRTVKNVFRLFKSFLIQYLGFFYLSIGHWLTSFFTLILKSHFFYYVSAVQCKKKF